MGALTMLAGFFLLFPVLALVAVLVMVALVIGIAAGMLSLAGGLVTYFATAGGVAKIVRSR